MANSFNELFGLGGHSEDANLEGWWPCQDDAASTVVDDASSNANDGTLQGGDNTATISTTGPNGWLQKALDLDGTNDYIEIGAVSAIYSASAMTLLARFNADGTSRGDLLGVWGASNTRKMLLTTGLPSASQKSVYTSNNGAAVQSPATDTASYSTGAWYSLGAVTDGADSEIFTNGSSAGISSAPSGLSTLSAILTIGASEGSLNKFAGLVCDASVFSRVLTSTEISQWHAGPELRYSSGASFGSDGSYNVGTWALPSPFDGGSNGTVTYEVIAVNAAGTVLDSDTASTGTLDLSANAGNTCYLLVRTTNTGGYDIGDKATRTSGYGSSNDGYYELASVTADAGGGGFQAAWARGSNVLIGV